MSRPFGRIFFANADVTGLPLFEEACYSGIRAAQGAMEVLQDSSMRIRFEEVFTKSSGLRESILPDCIDRTTDTNWLKWLVP